VFSDDDYALASRLLEDCKARRLRLAVAESCTGGLLGGLLTAIAGSSRVFDAGFVTYSNRAKTALLGVDADLLTHRGAVDADVARAMAVGAVTRAGVDLAVAITGIAGPDGGSAEKPVGLVHFASASAAGRTENRVHVFPGDRAAVRLASVREALAMLSALAGCTQHGARPA
jgi:nicotinamide-nucleotide amidase